MEIVVHNFRCYGQAAAHSFQFKRGVVTLIEGPSGIGKSTVLQAIYWSLYGKIRNITPKKSKKHSHTKVSLRLGNLLVVRENRPNRLQVIINDEETLLDDVAQEHINNIFGSRDMWKSTSYLEQKTICELLSNSPSARIEILNNLVFKGQYGPDQYIQQIINKIIEERTRLNELMAIYGPKIKILEDKLRTVIIPPKTVDLVVLRDEIIKYEKFIEKNSNKYNQQLRINIEYNVLSEQLKEVMIKLSQLPHQQQLEDELDQAQRSLDEWRTYKQIILEMERYNINNDDLNIIENISSLDDENIRREIAVLQQSSREFDYNAVQEEIKYHQRICEENDNLEEKLQISRKNLENISVLISEMEKYEMQNKRRSELLSIIGEISQDQIVPISIQNVTDAWSKYTRNMDLIIKLGINYSDESIQMCKDKLNRELENAKNHNKYMELILRIQKLQDQLELLGEDIDQNLSSEGLFELEQQKKNIERTLFCPNCQAPLIIDHDELHIQEEDISPDELEELDNYLQYYRSELPRTLKAISLAEEIDKIWDLIPENFKPSDEIDTESIIKNISIVEQLSYIEKPAYTVEEYIAIDELSRIEFNSKLNDNISLDQLRSSRDELIANCGILEEKIKHYNNSKQRLIELEEHGNNALRLEELQKQLRSIRIAWIRDNFVTKPEKDEVIYLALIDKNKPILQMIQSLEYERGNIENKLSSLTMDDEFINHYEDWKEKLSQTTLEWEEENKWEELRQANLELEDMISKINEVRHVVEKLERLKSRAIEVQTRYLETTVGSLTTHINSILEEIFDDPININISLTHTVKKTQSVISGVDIIINFKGGVHESVQELSGGEMDRLSLAFILALQRIHNNQILLLDETMSSLDFPMRTRCMNFVRQIAIMRDLIVIMINHEDTGGTVDQSIVLQ